MAREIRKEDFANLDTLVLACQKAKKLPINEKKSIVEESAPDRENRSVTPTFLQYAFPYSPYYPAYPYWSHSQTELPQDQTSCSPLFPTPPRTPEHVSHTAASHAPEMMINLKTFTAYLDETWPSSNSRRGSHVIRGGLYNQIVMVLNGGDIVNPKTRHWIKGCEFFVLENNDAAEKVIVAIPVVRGQKRVKHFTGSYKVVAKVEDFATIIAKYHNDATGHPGIRKTYAQVSYPCVRFIAASEVISLINGYTPTDPGRFCLPPKDSCGKVHRTVFLLQKQEEEQLQSADQELKPYLSICTTPTFHLSPLFSPIFLFNTSNFYQNYLTSCVLTYLHLE